MIQPLDPVEVRTATRFALDQLIAIVVAGPAGVLGFLGWRVALWNWTLGSA